MSEAFTIQGSVSARLRRPHIQNGWSFLALATLPTTLPRPAENFGKLGGEVINSGLFAGRDGRRKICGMQEGMRVVPFSRSCVGCNERFIVDVGLGNIGSAKVSLVILVPNSYVLSE